jgi:hypothetical protein
LHTHGIDRTVTGQATNQDRRVELAPFAVGDIGKQERPPVSFGDAATVLPAHQGMHLGVLVDFLIDDN